MLWYLILFFLLSGFIRFALEKKLKHRILFAQVFFPLPFVIFAYPFWDPAWRFFTLSFDVAIHFFAYTLVLWIAYFWPYALPPARAKNKIRLINQIAMPIYFGIKQMALWLAIFQGWGLQQQLFLQDLLATTHNSGALSLWFKKQSLSSESYERAINYGEKILLGDRWSPLHWIAKIQRNPIQELLQDQAVPQHVVARLIDRKEESLYPFLLSDPRLDEQYLIHFFEVHKQQLTIYPALAGNPKLPEVLFNFIVDQWKLENDPNILHALIANPALPDQLWINLLPTILKSDSLKHLALKNPQLPYELLDILCTDRRFALEVLAHPRNNPQILQKMKATFPKDEELQKIIFELGFKFSSKQGP